MYTCTHAHAHTALIGSHKVYLFCMIEILDSHTDIATNFAMISASGAAIFGSSKKFFKCTYWVFHWFAGLYGQVCKKKGCLGGRLSISRQHTDRLTTVLVFGRRSQGGSKTVSVGMIV